MNDLECDKKILLGSKEITNQDLVVMKNTIEKNTVNYMENNKIIYIYDSNKLEFDRKTRIVKLTYLNGKSKETEIKNLPITKKIFKKLTGDILYHMEKQIQI